MASPTGSEGPDFWTAVMAIATGIGGGLLALWRAANMMGSVKNEIKNMKEDIDKIDTKVDTRHEDHQKWMREVASKMVTKEDLHNLENLIRSAFGGRR